MLGSRLDNRVSRLLNSQIDHLESIVRKNDVDEILSDVVHIALHSREHDRSLLLRSRLLLHLRFKVSHRLLHHSRRIQHGRQLHLARPKQLAHRPHSVQQNRIDDVQRRILSERRIQQLLQRLLVCPLADPLLAIDDGEFQLVLNRQGLHVRSRRTLRLPF